MNNKTKNAARGTSKVGASQLQEIGKKFSHRKLDLDLSLGEMEKKSGITSVTIAGILKGEIKNPTV